MRPRLLARALVAAGVCTTLAAWALIGPFFMPGPATWWAELLRFVPWPGLVAPALLALAASWWLGRAWRLAAAVALTIVVVDAMDLRLGRAEDGQRPLRVMSWNAKAFVLTKTAARDEAIAAEIRRHAPDVLLLQDATDYGRADVALPEPLQQALQGYQVVRHWQYLIAARHPLRGCRMLFLGPSGPDAEGAMRCTLDVDGRAIDLVNVHFISPRAGLSALLDGVDRASIARWRRNHDARLHQARQLARALQGSAGPRIVAGDLNAIDASPVVQVLLATGLRDAFAAAGHGWGHTFGHSLFGLDVLRIDHVLVDASIAVHAVHLGVDETSEHRPVVADLRLERRR